MSKAKIIKVGYFNEDGTMSGWHFQSHKMICNDNLDGFSAAAGCGRLPNYIDKALVSTKCHKCDAPLSGLDGLEVARVDIKSGRTIEVYLLCEPCYKIVYANNKPSPE